MMPVPRQEFITLSTQEGIEPRWSISGAGTLSQGTVRVWVAIPDGASVDMVFTGSAESVLAAVKYFLYASEVEQVAIAEKYREEQAQLRQQQRAANNG